MFIGSANAQSVDLASLINQYRQSKGLAPLAVTGTLTCGAQTWASKEASLGLFGHEAANGSVATDESQASAAATATRIRACGDSGQFNGEIATTGQGLTDVGALEQFKNSAPHNAIMLGAGNAIGCGVATGPFQGFAGYNYYICDFATETGGQPSPIPTPNPKPTPAPVNQPPPTVCLPPLCGSTTGTGSSGPTTPSSPGCVPPTCASTSGNMGSSPGSGTGGTQCIPPTCASTIPGISSSGGLPASTQPGVSSSGGAPASTTGSGTSTSGGNIAGTGGTICNPPLCASTGGH